MSLNKPTIKIKKAIEEIIKEHNNVWEDIKYFGRDKGYRCCNLTEYQIITIASGLERKGYSNENIMC